MKGTIVTIDKAGSYNDMEINEVTFKHGEKVKFFIKKTDRNPNGDLVNNLKEEKITPKMMVFKPRAE